MRAIKPAWQSSCYSKGVAQCSRALNHLEKVARLWPTPRLWMASYLRVLLRRDIHPYFSCSSWVPDTKAKALGPTDRLCKKVQIQSLWAPQKVGNLIRKNFNWKLGLAPGDIECTWRWSQDPRQIFNTPWALLLGGTSTRLKLPSWVVHEGRCQY